MPFNGQLITDRDQYDRKQHIAKRKGKLVAIWTGFEVILMCFNKPGVTIVLQTLECTQPMFYAIDVTDFRFHSINVSSSVHLIAQSRR